MHVNWLAWRLDFADGYGRQGLYMLQALSRMGLDVTPVMEEMLQTPTWCQHLMGVDWGGITIINEAGNGVRSLPGRAWCSTMWEDSIVSSAWCESINEHCERLLVPAPHSAQVFKQGGVTVPLHIVPLGIDPREFAAFPFRLKANQRHPYTFMCLGDRGLRKGWDTTLLAFSTAFPVSQFPDVRLIIKTRKGEKLVPFSDSRISAWAEDVSSMADVFSQADCFVFPSKGEGWGLPPREAVALGVPTIAPRHTGLEVGIDCWATVILENLRMSESGMGNGGSWYIPDHEEVASAMHWCYENREMARQKAIGGGEWLRANQTWDHAAQIVVALLEKHG